MYEQIQSTSLKNKDLWLADTRLLQSTQQVFNFSVKQKGKKMHNEPYGFIILPSWGRHIKKVTLV